MSKAIRAFIAIDLPEPLRDRIAGLQLTLPVGRPVPAKNLHLTLAFLGDQPEAALEEAHHGLDRLDAPGFDLGLSGVDTFGGAAPRVVYAGVAKTPALDRLHKRVRASLRGAGVTLSRTRFRPHVTLARFRQGMSPFDQDRLRRFLTDHAGFRAGPFPVADFVLYASTLRPEGAEHSELARYRLT